MSDASGILSGDAGMSANAGGCVPDTIARMSNAAGILSGDRVMSHPIARMSDAAGVLSGNGVMSVSAERMSDETLSDLAGLSHVIAAVLSGGDAGRPLWGRAR